MFVCHKVTGTCRAFPEDMMRYLSTFLEPWFKKPNCGSYQIAFKSRNNNHSKRADVIKAIASKLQLDVNVSAISIFCISAALQGVTHTVYSCRFLSPSNPCSALQS